MVTLVTGATGLLGNNLVRHLLELGQTVRVLARDSVPPRSLDGLKVEVVQGDVRDAPSVQRACQGADKVFHAAARVHIGWTGLELQRAINVEGTRHVAQAAKEVGARMVHVSSVDTMGDGTRSKPADEETPCDGGVQCPYVITKREAEQVVLQQVAAGLNAVIVNPAFMLGPWDWKPSSGQLLIAVSQNRGTFAPAGGNDFCDVRDVAAGIVAAAEKGIAGRRYILGGHAMSYVEAFRLFAEITGGRRPWFKVGPHVIRIGGRAGDFWGWLTGREPDLNTAVTTMSSLPHHFSSERAKAELGYTMRPVRESAEAAWSWFKQMGYA
jgi:dihydroflavonol-4-reductase